MQRSKHSLSNTRLTSLDMGLVYPVGLLEVLPGDSFRHQTSALIRVSPLVAPVMHPVHVMIHHWYVPTRLLWDNWEDFITGKNPALVVPTIGVDSLDTGMWPLVQAMGVGADTRTTDLVLNSLPFRAYNQIWNEFYRDQDLNPALNERKGDTGDLVTDYAIRNCSWEKDYFTTCRPQPQQGAGTESIAVNIAGNLPVTGIGTLGRAFSQSNAAVYETGMGGTTTNYPNAAYTATAGQMMVRGSAAASGNPEVYASGAGLSASMDINQWRLSFAMQRMREHRNRYGSRYRDLLAFLGVNSSDARLQRPEYLGGGKQTISFSEVLATADVPSGSNVGDMAGHGIAAMRTRTYKRFFEEHGYVLSFMVVRPRTVYMNRVPRHWLRRDYEQYWQKELEIMGDQAVTNTEVYGDTVTPSNVFGYIPRYDEYRHEEGSVSGEFRNILDYWHMARDFSSQPNLNAAFVSCDPTTRIYGSAVNDQLYAMIAHRISTRRLVSKFARN